MRHVWTFDAGFPHPLVNRPLFDLQGRLLGYPDIFDPDSGTIGEYDGSDHAAVDRRHRDGAREDLFKAHRLAYVEVVTGDLRNTALVVRRMRRAREVEARWLAPGERSWTLDPPAWWRGE